MILQELGLKAAALSASAITLSSHAGQSFVYAATLRRYKFDKNGQLVAPEHKMTNARISLSCKDGSSSQAFAARTEPCDGSSDTQTSDDDSDDHEEDQGAIDLPEELYETDEAWHELQIL